MPYTQIKITSYTEKMKKDWIGNTNSVFKTLGSSHHTEDERQINDYYATDPAAVKMLLELETFSNSILEPACGEGHLSKELIKHGHHVISMDLIDRGYGSTGCDFLKMADPEYENSFSGDVITNPPYTFGPKQHSALFANRWRGLLSIMKMLNRNS